MKLIDYEDKVVGLLKPEIANAPQHEKVLYLVSKLSSEFGEFIGEYCKKIYHGKKVTNETLISELGDVAWYLYNLFNFCRGQVRKDTDLEIKQMIDGRFVKNSDSVFATSMDIIRTIGCLAENWMMGKTDPAELEQTIASLVVLFHVLVYELEFDMETILDGNINKLTARHGASYNPSFYKGDSV
jgi:NTP pyrophosphatase (non-canonical NTP hydrolase)